MQDEIENTATDPTETDADPAAPSVEPSHGIAPAQTQVDAEELPPTDASTPSEEDAAGDETDEGQPEAAENDEIDEIEEAGEASDESD